MLTKRLTTLKRVVFCDARHPKRVISYINDNHFHLRHYHSAANSSAKMNTLVNEANPMVLNPSISTHPKSYQSMTSLMTSVIPFSSIGNATGVKLQQQRQHDSSFSTVDSSSPSVLPNALLLNHPSNIITSISIDSCMSIKEQTLQSIILLPEVKEAFAKLCTTRDISCPSSESEIYKLLNRSIEIFTQIFGSGSDEHMAVLNILGVVHSLHGDYDQSALILARLQDISKSTSRSLDHIQFNMTRAKLEFLMGNFTACRELSEKCLRVVQKPTECTNNVNNSSPDLSVESAVQLSSILMGVSMSRMMIFAALNSSNRESTAQQVEQLQLPDLNDGIEGYVLDPLREANDLLREQYEEVLQIKESSSASIITSNLCLSLALSYMNVGIVELCMRQIINSVDNDQNRKHNDAAGSSTIEENEVQTVKKGLSKTTLLATKAVARQSWNHCVSLCESLLLSKEGKVSKIGRVSDDNICDRAKFIKAMAHCCIASSILDDENSKWNVLEDDKATPKNKSTPITEEELRSASASAGAALSQLEDLVQTSQDGNNLMSAQVYRTVMGNALSLVAACYAKSGSAVTAEGLFQSSLDKYPQYLNIPLLQQAGDVHGATTAANVMNKEGRPCLLPFSAMYAAATHRRYSELCQNWDKRESDALRLAKTANSIEDASLRGDWKYAPVLSSSLCFFLPSDFAT